MLIDLKNSSIKRIGNATQNRSRGVELSELALTARDANHDAILPELCFYSSTNIAITYSRYRSNFLLYLLGCFLQYELIPLRLRRLQWWLIEERKTSERECRNKNEEREYEFNMPIIRGRAEILT